MKREVDWRPWGDEAFAEACRQGKPVLLSIGAVWCHWCHVMDRTSYGDRAVTETIAERYVPIRVDTDQRPDVNARYNMGGWPTTAILTPEGELLTGATYVPPEQMCAMLDEVADAYATRKDEIERALEERAERLRARSGSDDAPLEPSIVPTTLASLEAVYDDRFGGFGSEPKFPQTDVLEFLVLLDRRERDGRLDAMLAKTLLGMARGGMYDHVEGGFFRYSTTRDWAVPHFEKMSEDHAGLIRAYARAWRLLGIAPLRDTLLSALAYLRRTLRDPTTGFFAGSQDADEAYYALPLAERRARPAPYIDRIVYTNWNAGLASAFAVAGRALDDDTLVAEALATLDAIDAQLLDARGLCFHFRRPGEAPQVQNLLIDQVAYLRALLDAHEISGEPRLRERALALSRTVLEVFDDSHGAFVDHANDGGPGRLAMRDSALGENANLADSLLRLSAMTGDQQFAARAERTLRAFAARYAEARSFAASYAGSVARALWGGASVAIIGSPAETAPLREAALSLGDPLLSVVTFEANDPLAAERGLTATGTPRAYPCRGRVCGTPIEDPAELGDAFGVLAAP
jgi:uncharacterized protein YyaL (SSP411 family)